MRQLIRTYGLTAGSLYKLIFTGFLFSLGPILIINGIFSYFGYHTMYVNDRVLTGVEGLLAGLLLAPLVSLVTASIVWVFLFIGIWLYSKFAIIRLYHKAL